MVVENLDDLRDLVKKFAEPEPIIEKKGKKEKVNCYITRFSSDIPFEKKCQRQMCVLVSYISFQNILFQIIQPPPRKRCEKELHDRLEYLLTELEPWEQKLLQANKRAKIRLRKQHESYVEEPEPKVD